MERMIAAEPDDDLKKAYDEMLTGSLSHPEDRDWYAMWIIEKTDGTRIGDLCFKGVEAGRNPEIGYGIREAFRGRGYATEAVRLALRWAFRHREVKAVEAETDPDNTASQKVLIKCGFHPMGIMGGDAQRLDQSGGRPYFEIYDAEDAHSSEAAPIMSFWAVLEGDCIRPEIDPDEPWDAWLLNIQLDKKAEDELIFTLEDGVLSASYFYYDADCREACDMSFLLAPETEEQSTDSIAGLSATEISSLTVNCS